MQINGSTAAEDTLQTFQEVQLEAAEDEEESEDKSEAAVVAPSSATLDVPEASLDNGAGAGGGSERGERVKGEISMLSSPLQVRTRKNVPQAIIRLSYCPIF